MAPEPIDDSTVVRVGSVVTIRGQSEPEHDITIADAATGNGIGQLTTRTPLARALLGRQAGEEASVVVDAGTVRYQIVRVRS